MSERELRKRQRGKNFTAADEILLLELVEERKHIIENKKSDSVTWKQKSDCWEKLAQEFAFLSRSGMPRSWKTLRDKYENMKRGSKKALAADKQITYWTGERPAAKCSISNMSETISDLIGESTSGLYNIFDNDSSQPSQPTSTPSKADESNSCMQEEFDSKSGITEILDENALALSSVPPFNPSMLREKLQKKLAVSTSKQGRDRLNKEKIALIKLQQAFCRDENSRAAEKHKLEVEREKLKLEAMRLKNELLELEIEEKRLKK